jgi:hypothetical protein
MSFEPITRWMLRCDGQVGNGQCLQQWVYDSGDPERPVYAGGPESDDVEDGRVIVPVVFDEPALSEQDREELHYAGWLLARDGHLLCPRHVAGLEYLAAAAVDGLPFDELAVDGLGGDAGGGRA